MATQTKKPRKKVGVSTVKGRKTKARKAKTGTSGRSTFVRLVNSPRGSRMLALRSRLGLTRDVFARMIPVSPRSVASIENGIAPSEAVTRKLTELGRIVDGLSKVMTSEAIGQWLKTPNDAFDDLKPLEVIERGEVDRIWQMIFLLRSGVPG